LESKVLDVGFDGQVEQEMVGCMLVGHLVMLMEEGGMSGDRVVLCRRNGWQMMLIVVVMATTMVQKRRAPFEIILLIHQRLSVGGRSCGDGIISQALHSYNISPE
jgi:hypothetical protein